MDDLFVLLRCAAHVNYITPYHSKGGPIAQPQKAPILKKGIFFFLLTLSLLHENDFPSLIFKNKIEKKNKSYALFIKMWVTLAEFNSPKKIPAK